MDRKHRSQSPSSNCSYLWRIELPCPIEADWDPKWGPRLAGFPVELVYSSDGRSGEKRRPAHVRKAYYSFEPRSFFEDRTKKQMHYFPRLPSQYYVVVKWDKAAKRWITRKFGGDRLVVEAIGRTFEQVMVHTLLVGLQPDEPEE